MTSALTLALELRARIENHSRDLALKSSADGARGYHNYYVSEPKKRPDIVYIENVLGKDLVTSSKKSLRLNFSARSAIIADRNGIKFIAHDGSLRSTKIRALDGYDIISSGGKPYFLISRLDDKNLFVKIIDYHLARGDKTIKSGAESVPGDQPGAAKGGERSSAVWSAKHHPICVKLAKALKASKHFSGPERRFNGADIVRKAFGIHFIFEVKPDCGTHNIVTALGQLLHYSRGEKRIALVVAVPDDSPIDSSLMDTLNRHNVFFLNVGKSGPVDLNPLLAKFGN